MNTLRYDDEFSDLFYTPNYRGHYTLNFFSNPDDPEDPWTNTNPNVLRLPPPIRLFRAPRMVKRRRPLVFDILPTIEDDDRF
jgi:hypothetical protein